MTFAIDPQAFIEITKDSQQFMGVIKQVNKRFFMVEKHDGKEIYLSTLSHTNYKQNHTERTPVTVGDHVVCTVEGVKQHQFSDQYQNCKILHRKERLNSIGRQDPNCSHRQHVLAANMDQILIVASFFQPGFDWELIEKFILLAEENGINPIIVFNKVDLIEENKSDHWQEVQAIYHSLGYPCFTLTDIDYVHYDQLGALLQGKTTLIAGESGVGKSTIVNYFSQERQQAVDPYEIINKGRRTTSYSRMIHIKPNGYLIDTPGLSKLKTPAFTPTELTLYFKEMRAYYGQCRFRDCSHLSEPGCSIREALELKKISQFRYNSYRNLLTRRMEEDSVHFQRF